MATMSNAGAIVVKRCRGSSDVSVATTSDVGAMATSIVGVMIVEQV